LLALFFQRQALFDELSSFVLAQIVVVFAKKPYLVTPTFLPLLKVCRKPIVDGPKLAGLIAGQGKIAIY